MKTIGTVINTVIVVFGMLCSLIAGAFVGYSMAKDENRRPTYKQFTSDYHNGYSCGYSNGFRDGRDESEREKELKEEYGEEENEDI